MKAFFALLLRLIMAYKSACGRMRSLRLPISIVLCCLYGSAWALPSAANGLLDLSSVNIQQKGSLSLDGEWEFYPGQLLAPAAFAQSRPLASVDYLALPASWNGFLKDGRKLDGSGVATFRLRVLPPQQGTDLALRIFDVQSAYRLWLNGKLVSARGIVGERAELEVADPSLDLPFFRNDGVPLELVLEVSNHNFRDGGVIASILLGTPEAIRSGQNRQWGIALFILGSLLVMGCYHLLFYYFRRASASPLYFGLYCLLWMGNILTSDASAWVIRLFLPDLAFESLLRFGTVFFLLSVPIGYLFFRSLFAQEFSSAIMKATLALFSGFVVLVLLAPVPVVLAGTPLYYLASVMLIAYCLFRLAAAWRRHREGAAFILAGFAFLGLIAANDMLYDLQVIHSVYLIHVGMFFFIIAQGFALALSFSRAFSSVERLSSELAGRNAALEQEVAERTRLEREIVNISEHERRCLSHDLHDGLCQQLTAGRLLCSVLVRNSGDDRPGHAELAQLSSLLDASARQAYELSRGLWPVEHDQQGMSSFLEDFCRRLAESSGLAITVRQARACVSCSNENVTQLYRIAQEAISNAVKHAQASLIEVALDCVSPTAKLVLSVRDDGIGRNAAPLSTQGGLGMRIMAHRARMIQGSLQVGDAEGGGTLVTCHLQCVHCAQNRK